MVRSALESVNVFTSWLARSLLLTSMRFDSSLVTNNIRGEYKWPTELEKD